MDEFVFQFGYLGLFIISFLAATLLPLGSELFVAAMTLSGFNVALVFVVATVGNTLGAMTNYYVGKLGAGFIFSRFIKVDQEKRQNVERIYHKWGSPALFFSWAPVVGDPLTVVAGGFNLKFSVFILWVLIGKAFRYALVILTAKNF